MIDVSKVTVKGDGLQRAAVNSSTTFRLSTKSAGEANLDVTVTGDYDQLATLISMSVSTSIYTAHKRITSIVLYALVRSERKRLLSEFENI